MIRINPTEFESMINSGEGEFKYRIEPNIISQLQLYLTGNITEGVEVFGIGPNELRAFGFLIEYGKEINFAIRNNYRVFVSKEGKYFGRGGWYLAFINKVERS